MKKWNVLHIAYKVCTIVMNLQAQKGNMKMKNRFYPGVAAGIAVVLAITCCYRNVQIKAEDLSEDAASIKVETDAPNLIDNYDNDSILCNKLEYDVDNNTTDLKDDVEEKLNEAGVFDEEINDLDDETIEELNKSINTSVYINYVSVDESTNGVVEEMNDSEIEDVIEQRIEDGKILYEEDKSLLEKIGQAVGILPTDVKGAEPLHKEGNYPKTKGKVKQTIYACQFKKKGTIYVTAKAYWLEEAYYKNIDIFGVTVKNGNIIRNTAKCTHKANYVSYAAAYKNGEYKEKKETHPDAFRYDADAVACKVNLFGNRKTIEAEIYAYVFDYYKDESIELKFQCRYEKKVVVFATSYNHAMTNKSISPSISLGSGGISVGISGTSTNYYSELFYNAYLDYTHI